MRIALQISAPKRRQLLTAVAHLLEAKKILGRAAASSSAGGVLLPSHDDRLNTLMGELLELVSAATPKRKGAKR